MTGRHTRLLSLEKRLAVVEKRRARERTEPSSVLWLGC
jgi:hypothetical protein